MTDVSKETLIAAVSRRDPAGAHCKNRLFEVGDWHDARHRAVHPVHAEDDIRRRVPLLLEANWNAQVIATIFVGFGIVRASATRTGHWQPWGARWRAFCAVAAAFMWFQMGLALVLLTRVTGTLSVGVRSMQS